MSSRSKKTISNFNEDMMGTGSRAGIYKDNMKAFQSLDSAKLAVYGNRSEKLGEDSRADLNNQLVTVEKRSELELERCDNGQDGDAD